MEREESEAEAGLDSKTRRDRRIKAARRTEVDLIEFRHPTTVRA
jgi:hypothetical protein